MNLAELTDLELAEMVLNKTEAAIRTDSFTNKTWIAASAQIDLESFFRELRQAWQREEHDRKSRELTGEFPQDIDWEYNLR